MVLAGPPAIGHNTVAEAVARLRGRLALIDLDDVRGIERAPHAAWGSAEKERWLRDGMRRAALLAQDCAGGGTDVLLVDVAPPDLLDEFRAALGPDAVFALLSAPVDVVVGRDTARDPDPNPDLVALAAWQGRIRMLHAQAEAARDRYDVIVDNSTSDPEPAATAVAALFER